MRIKKTALGVALICFILSGCGNQEIDGAVGTSGEGIGGSAGSDSVGVAENSDVAGFEITEEDSRISFAEDAVRVNLGDTSGAYEISEGGDYVLTGSGDCRVVIDSKEQPVHLFLDGVSLRESEGGAILVLSASKVVITCLEGTDNVLSDSAYYRESKEYDACVYSFADLTINGAGSLRVTGLFEDGIHSKDVVKVLGTNLEVKAKGDGVRGNDGVCFVSASGCVVEAEKNGLRTSKNGHDVKGSVEIRDTEMSVIAGKYAVESYDKLMVSGSSLYLNGVLGKWQVAGDLMVEEGNVSGGR